MAGLTLVRSRWAKAGVRLVTDALEAGSGMTRLVGGAVRDGLLGLPVKDIDFATRFEPEEVIARLQKAGLRTVPTGIGHGTVTALLNWGGVEITTLRRDVSTDGRRATIAFSDDWQEDAARRDFTFNALYADPESGEIFDYFDGMADLEEGLVRFIGDPLTRIAEDHLRIMRFFRFHARFGKGPPDPASLSACATRANDLMALSRERVADELLKLLALPDPAPTIALMLDQGIFAPVLPEIASADDLARLVTRENEAGEPPEPLRRLAALLPPDQGVATEVAARLRLSNKARKRLEAVASRQQDDGKDPRALAYWEGRDVAIDRLLIGSGSTAELRGWEPPSLPVSGKDVIGHGVTAGPQVAAILKRAEQQWVSEKFPDLGRLQQLLAIEAAKER